MLITLQPQALTAEAFEPFGEVIQMHAGAQHFPMNGGKLERYYDLANIDVGVETGGRPVLSIAQCKRVTKLPLDINMMERHPHGSQAIYPLFNQTMMMVVAPVSETIDPQQVRAFYSDGQQGINFAAAVWHLPIIAMRPEQKFMLIDRGGDNHNCDEFHFPASRKIRLMPAPGSLEQ